MPDLILASVTAETTTKAVDAAFTTLGSATDFMWNIFSDMTSTILANPILIVPFAIFVIGGGIGLVKRII